MKINKTNIKFTNEFIRNCYYFKRINKSITIIFESNINFNNLNYEIFKRTIFITTIIIKLCCY